MKRVISSRSYSYNGYQIYDDPEQGLWYIYTQPNGKGRIDFATDKDAEEYVDSLSDVQDESARTKTYSVYYIDKYTDNTTSCVVYAKNESEAIQVAKKEWGRYIYRILRAEELR